MDILTNPFIFLSDRNKRLQKGRMQENPRDLQHLYPAGGVGNTTDLFFVTRTSLYLRATLW